MKKIILFLVPCFAVVLLFISLTLSNVVIQNAKANMNEARKRTLLV